MKKIGYLLVLLAAIFWGTIGIPVNALEKLGMTSYEIGVTRSLFGTILVGIFMLCFDRDSFKFNLKILPLLIGVGAASQAGLNIGYFVAIEQLGIGIAVVLLYTSPIFANILSLLIFREKINLTKGISMILAIIGCFLAVTGGQFAVSLGIFGILGGLLAGFSFGATPIFSKKLSGNSTILQVLFYSFLSGTIIQLFFIDFNIYLQKLDSSTLIHGLILAIFPTILSFAFYNRGLKYIEPGIASIICVMEVVVSTLIARFYFLESLGTVKTVGIIFMIIASILPNITFGRKLIKKRIIT